MLRATMVHQAATGFARSKYVPLIQPIGGSDGTSGANSVSYERICTSGANNSVMSEYVPNCRPPGGSDGTSGTTDLGGWIPAGTCSGGTSAGSGADLYYQGYIGGFKCDGNGVVIPNNAGGTETTYTRDRLYYRTTAKRLARFGGHSSDGAYCGAFACTLIIYVSYSLWSYGASPSFHGFDKKETGPTGPAPYFFNL